MFNQSTISVNSTMTTYSEPWYDHPLNMQYSEIEEKSSKIYSFFRNKSFRRKSMINKAKGEMRKVIETLKEKKMKKESDKDSGIVDNFSLSQEIEDSFYDKTDLFCQLKMERDTELLKIHQATRAMELLKKSKHHDLSEELLIERILLESSSRQKMILERIQHLGYSETKKRYCSGRVVISNVKLNVKCNDKSRLEEYFVMQARIGYRMYISKPQIAQNNKVQFKDTIIFDDLETNFNIHLQWYRIKLEVSGKKLKKKSNILNKVCRITFDDIHTLNHEEKEVFQTSFNLVGELNLTKEYLAKNPQTFELTSTSLSSSLERKIEMDLKANDVLIYSKFRLFLNVGKMMHNQIFWERKWCVLDGERLKIYSYPSDEEFGQTPDQLILTKEVEITLSDPQCPRKRSFSLTVVDRKLFFMSENLEEFQESTKQLNFVLKNLRIWNV
ncbi:unnamed protein product [Brassicogethes aeneus]|uniref:PH domain-containing protein n=1 Tax=Brassicogethes aeneus TaxID=1431903 RepID=A0A9P0B5J8_BRAAE|nr:unnamed protein product [Brassicogethes aeneus]